ncbi:membrane protein insertion efficiency factor YidD [Dechloromonas denitrificans]|uniref:membrane protein insertion efficiency factor YidD n=1 Tax=Dechloromonas denitrificans TaxID=281362 RepID=UPI001CF8305D|nr:membrane protein insertion efficiency factor YidD [Dechloromonas denitrificans]
MLRYAAAQAIGSYQRHISPKKGFACAFRVHTGHCSCSEFARRFVLRAGVWRLLHALPRRFIRCRNASIALSESQANEPGKNGTGHDPYPKDCAVIGAAECGTYACCFWPF